METQLTGQTVLMPRYPYGEVRTYTRTVRDIQQWDGRTVGWIRHDRGDWVVQRTRTSAWEVLSGVSVTELQRGRQNAAMAALLLEVTK